MQPLGCSVPDMTAGCLSYYKITSLQSGGLSSNTLHCHMTTIPFIAIGVLVLLWLEFVYVFDDVVLGDDYVIVVFIIYSLSSFMIALFRSPL